MPSKPSLLLLHGAIGAEDQLQPLAAALALYYEVRTMSFMGHGHREPVNIPFTMKHFAEDVLAFMDENNIAQTHIFGYSMGGYVALYLARYYPERVDRIITLGTKFHWTPEIAAHETKMLQADKIAEKVPRFAAILQQRHAHAGWETVLAKTAELLQQLGMYNTLTLPDYAHIPHNTTILLGDGDQMVTEAESRDVADMLPNGTFDILPHTEHPIEKVPVETLAKRIRSATPLLA